MHLSFLFAGCLAASVLAVPTTHVVHERRSQSSKKWNKRNRVVPDAVLPIRIGLKQNNLDRAANFLMDVSHPSSPNYAKHWTADEVIKTFAPSAATVDAVRNWLLAAGIHPDRIVHSDNKGWLAFDATTDEAESLMHAEYYEYHEPTTGKIAVACDDAYHVPAHLSKHIDYITPGVKLSAPLKRTVSKRWHGPTGSPMHKHPPWGPWPNPQKDNVTNCDSIITPACIRALYEVPLPNYRGGPNPNNAMGIYESEDTYSQKDLNLFFANFTPYIPKGTHPTLASVDGAKAPVPVKQAGGESDLDFQLAYPILWPQNITLYQVDDSYYASGSATSSSGEFNTWLDALDGSYCTYSAYGETGNDPIDPVYPDPHKGGYKGQLMCGVYKSTNVITVSYGVQEDDLPAYYQERQCNEFLKLGLQGTSIFVASGDTGVAGYPGDVHKNGCLGPNADVFSPTNPNSCPWLTNVGATEVYPGRTVFEPESAVEDLKPRFNYSSSGGFSNIYGIPDYQKSAIATYFADYNPPYPYYEGGQYVNSSIGLYNRLGRGIPDVAANGLNIAVYNQGEFVLEGGTSASSPIFASIVNRINEERLSAGKKPVGFINPALYENPWVLNDITNGSNPGCGTNGFSAVKGWDPVTGLGTPNYPRMLKLFMSLP